MMGNTKIILSQSIKRRLATQFPNQELEYGIKNIKVNGDSRGCSGFIKNNKTGILIYINTEPSGCYFRPTLSDKRTGYNILIRYAKDMKDYRGGMNYFVDAYYLYDILVDILKGEKKLRY